MPMDGKETRWIDVEARARVAVAMSATVERDYGGASTSPRNYNNHQQQQVLIHPLSVYKFWTFVIHLFSMLNQYLLYLHL